MAYPHNPYPPPPPPPKTGGGGKALPIACGAGLAVGVFVGLLVIRGTGEAEAGASDETATPDAAVIAADTTPDAAPPPAVIDAAPPVIDAAPAIRKAKLTFEGINDVDGVDIEIDGVRVEGKTHEIVLGDKKQVEVKVTASARGYRTFRDRVVVTTDQIVEIEMRRRRRSGGGRDNDTGKKPPGGLIDL